MLQRCLSISRRLKNMCNTLMMHQAKFLFPFFFDNNDDDNRHPREKVQARKHEKDTNLCMQKMHIWLQAERCNFKELLLLIKY